jgi:hypothetical protein
VRRAYKVAQPLDDDQQRRPDATVNNPRVATRSGRHDHFRIGTIKRPTAMATVEHQTRPTSDRNHPTTKFSYDHVIPPTIRNESPSSIMSGERLHRHQTSNHVSRSPALYGTWRYRYR